MNDSKKETIKLKKGFLDIFSSISSLSYSSTSSSSSSATSATSFHASVLNISIASIPDPELGILCAEMTEKIVENVLNNRSQIEDVVQHLVKLHQRHIDDNTIALRFMSCL